ncbi:hypothetical protein WIV_gp144 [Wiseana iridescent virus]|uniref:Uncharacterized protein n=1 Tax=Wiseana iridescent virus TaxID=68347 RepID=G0T5H0_IRV9|nr:hypothetical protein WIV_gp144 [Wiseana iridescent virus]ADO00488.1 hypothetical protein [Wiseana iridescent virus]
MTLYPIHKLTLDERQNIIDLYNSGTTIAYLSRQFKVSRPTIYSIIQKRLNDQKEIDFYTAKIEENKDLNMENPTTNFLGITIDSENSSSNPKINKALNKSLSLLNIIQFIEVTKFKINSVMFDYFWQVVVGNHSVHLVTMIFDWFGYEGENKEQKRNFKKMLKNNNISYRELTHKDNEIELYPSIKKELSKMATCDIVKSKFLIMEPKDLKMAIMQLKTKNGHTIRQYYIDLEELLKLYTEYTLYFNHRESQRKITDLEKMMADMNLTMQRQEKYMQSMGIQLEDVKDQNEELLDKTRGLKKQNKQIQRKLGIAVEDRAPQPEDESKRERFILMKRNNDEYYPYYTIRAQDGYTTRKIKIQKNYFPDLEILLDFKCNPNSKTLYNRIKENLKTKGVEFTGNNIDLRESQVLEEELIKEMEVINDQRYNV